MSRIDAAGIAAQNGTGPGGMGLKKTTMDFFVPVEEASPGANMEEMEADETIGSRFPTDREVGTVFFEPELSGKVRATNLPRLLSSYMGQPVTTETVPATVYRHVFDPTLAGATPRAMSLLLHRADPVPPITDLFWDALGNDLTLSVETDDWLSFESTFVARELDDTQPAPTVVQDLTRKFPFYKLSAFVKVGAGVEEPVALSEFEVAWTGNIDTDASQLGSRKLFRVAPGNVDVEVTFTTLQDLIEYYRRALLTEPEAIQLRLRADGPIISGAEGYYIEIVLHRLIETEATADIDAGETLLGAEITAQAALDPATGKFYTVTVQNATANYTIA